MEECHIPSDFLNTLPPVLSHIADCTEKLAELPDGTTNGELMEERLNAISAALLASPGKVKTYGQFVLRLHTNKRGHGPYCWYLNWIKVQPNPDPEAQIRYFLHPQWGCFKPGLS